MTALPLVISWCLRGAVLEADVEIDRRDMTVAAALRVAPGERLALFGPSGAGKTTLLEMIAGLVPPRRGQVTLAGRVLTQTTPPRRAVPPWRRRIGLLRQDPGLFPHLTVRQNLEYGAGRHPDPARTTRLAADLGIETLLADRPARLSGGQAHRVALGRLLLGQCDALLLDEPYTGLDASLRRTLTGLVRTLAADAGVPVVLVAHELTDAQAFADRLAVLDRGRLLQDGPAGEVARRPASRRVAALVGYLSFVPLAGRDGAVAGVHPERVVPGAHPGRGLVLSGTVCALYPAGAGWEAGLQLSSGAPGRGQGPDVTGPGAAAPGAAGPGPGGSGPAPVTAGRRGAAAASSAEPDLVWCRLPEAPGAEATVTVLDPPYFGADGVLLPGLPTQPGRVQAWWPWGGDGPGSRGD